VSTASERISETSFRLIEQEVDLTRFGPGARVVATRIVHATADPSLVADLVLDEEVVQRAVALLRAGAPVIVDARMVAAGATRVEATVSLESPVEPDSNHTRSYLAMRATLAHCDQPAIVCVGNAPTALEAVLDDPRRASVVLGFCVGFVGAREAKDRLLASGLPALLLRGRRGGSAVAASALNALRMLADDSTY
jgi:precorrin-8X/cobalt-precorrin-8 methylmutase